MNFSAFMINYSCRMSIYINARAEWLMRVGGHAGHSALEGHVAVHVSDAREQQIFCWETSAVSVGALMIESLIHDFQLPNSRI